MGKCVYAVYYPYDGSLPNNRGYKCKLTGNTCPDKTVFGVEKCGVKGKRKAGGKKDDKKETERKTERNKDKRTGNRNPPKRRKRD